MGQTEYSAWAVLTSAGVIVIGPLFDYSGPTRWSAGSRPSASIWPPSSTSTAATATPITPAAPPYLQDRYQARVVVSAEDRDLMDRTPGAWKKPRRDIVGIDRHQVTLGDTTLTLHQTPGHTLGAFSTIIPLRDRSETSRRSASVRHWRRSTWPAR